MDTRLRDGIHWVGVIDKAVRDFHGYHTERGSTYNAYLVQDEKTVLVDTVKAPYVDVLLKHVSAFCDPATVDLVVCNHAEPDHSGGLPAVMAACTQAELVCSTKCAAALAQHYDTAGWRIRTVEDGETLSIGKRTLTFVHTPMVHWPESMFTYVPEEKLLFSMDAFGQHYASDGRFDDEEPLDAVMQEAKTYYANIVMLYGKPIARVLERAASLDIEMIAPSHGVIWRKDLGTILSAYRRWVVYRPEAKVLILYDTMWKSTEAMARAIEEGAAETGVDVRRLYVRDTDITRIATESLDAAAFAFGSPTLNKTLMPQMAAVLTYLKGLSPTGKAGFVFGSYGWGQNAAQDMTRYLEDMKFTILREPLCHPFVPTEAALTECRAAGRLLGDVARKAAEGQG